MSRAVDACVDLTASNPERALLTDEASLELLWGECLEPVDPLAEIDDDSRVDAEFRPPNTEQDGTTKNNPAKATTNSQKRPRGRPKKVTVFQDGAKTQKRPRGRPRKITGTRPSPDPDLDSSNLDTDSLDNSVGPAPSQGHRASEVFGPSQAYEASQEHRPSQSGSQQLGIFLRPELLQGRWLMQRNGLSQGNEPLPGRRSLQRRRSSLGPGPLHVHEYLQGRDSSQEPGPSRRPSSAASDDPDYIPDSDVGQGMTASSENGDAEVHEVVQQAWSDLEPLSRPSEEFALDDEPGIQRVFVDCFLHKPDICSALCSTLGLSNVDVPLFAHASREKPRNSDRNRLVQCTTCKHAFSHVYFAVRHVLDHHAHVAGVQRMSTQPDAWREVKSIDRGFRLVYSLASYRKPTEPEERHFECAECGRVLASRVNLVQHLAVLHPTPDAGADFLCTVCGRRFFTIRQLRNHRHVHDKTPTPQAVCSVCGKTYKSSFLVQHMRSHTGEKPFKCEQCGKECQYRQTLRKHMLIHTNAKPFECVACGKTFGRPCHLRTHMRTHTGDKPYACSLCEESFMYYNERVQHLEKVHGQVRQGKGKGRPVRDKKGPVEHAN